MHDLKPNARYCFRFCLIAKFEALFFILCKCWWLIVDLPHKWRINIFIYIEWKFKFKLETVSHSIEFINVNLNYYQKTKFVLYSTFSNYQLIIMVFMCEWNELNWRTGAVDVVRCTSNRGIFYWALYWRLAFARMKNFLAKRSLKYPFIDDNF